MYPCGLLIIAVITN